MPDPITITLEQHSPRMCERMRLFSPGHFLCRGYKKDWDLKKPSVAIVGTRRPTSYGIRFIRDFVPRLKGFDWNIVSGGALGIDGEAHRTALCHGLRSQAYVVGPLTNPNPSAHRALFQDLEGAPGSGLIVPSELEPASSEFIYKSFWIQRNQWLAAASDAVIVVEASLKSGTWSTIKYADQFGIPVFILPGPENSKQSEGNNLMIARGYGHAIVSVEKLVADLVVDLERNPYNRSIESFEPWHDRLKVGPSDDDKILDLLRNKLDRAGGIGLYEIPNLATELDLSWAEVINGLKKLSENDELWTLGNRFERKGRLI